MTISRKEIIELLTASGEAQAVLFEKASKIRGLSAGSKVYFRGLIEFSNVCKNDCLYCGIRCSNKKVERYTMTADDIMSCVDFSNDAGYGSVVLQSGERTDKAFLELVENIVTQAHSKYPKMGITLAVGEQSREVYQRFFNAGASRYLLRIETSNEEHYKKLHPGDMDFKKRVDCLKVLKETGYQVGTGVMIGSPHQTLEHLADDILFFKELDVDMVGMGPFLAHQDTEFSNFDSRGNLELALNMIAALRIVMPTINIASATALQAMTPNGRELGLIAGANVIMPLVTPKKYRDGFRLYDNKPCLDESAEQCKHCLIKRVENTGLVPALNESGDSVHYIKRKELSLRANAPCPPCSSGGKRSPK